MYFVSMYRKCERNLKINITQRNDQQVGSVNLHLAHDVNDFLLTGL